MFAVIYKGAIPPQDEARYRALWSMVAAFFIEHRGAMGSRLHKTADGMLLAYSCWPNQKARDDSWPKDGEPNASFPEDIKLAIKEMKSLALEPFEEIPMQVLEDKLFNR